MIVARVESVLTTPTVQGDPALRHVLRLHPRTLARLDHDAYVQAVTFSPDGTRVATGSEDGSARVFETAPYALVRRAIDVMTLPLSWRGSGADWMLAAGRTEWAILNGATGLFGGYGWAGRMAIGRTDMAAVPGWLAGLGSGISGGAVMRPRE